MRHVIRWLVFFPILTLACSGKDGSVSDPPLSDGGGAEQQSNDSGGAGGTKTSKTASDGTSRGGNTPESTAQGGEDASSGGTTSRESAPGGASTIATGGVSSGGTSSTGGITGATGGASTGGASTIATGGVSNGGTPSTGGASTIATGGVSNGGTPSTGGNTGATGGASTGGASTITTGGVSTGGTPSTGGNTGANGGASASAGSSAGTGVARQMDAGNLHNCAIIADGTLRCWGNGAYGQLGDGSTTNRTLPVTVKTLTGASRVSSGGFVTCAVAEDTTLACFGLNAKGQLGNGTTNNSSTPVTVSGLGSSLFASVGPAHTCALRADNAVYCWGDKNSYLYTVTGSSNLVPSPNVDHLVATSLAAGNRHSCGILASGELYCWGNIDYYQLGPSPNLTAVQEVATGYEHTCALTADGAVRCFGFNDSGQLGDGTFVTRQAAVAVPGLNNAIAITAGYGHSCALLADKTVACWGSNSHGQLGDGTTLTRTTQSRVPGISNAVAISAGWAHTCALLDNGSVSCWGWNAFGQLAQNDTVSRASPSRVLGLSPTEGVGGTGGTLGTGGTASTGGAIAAGGTGTTGAGGTNDLCTNCVGDAPLPPRLVAPSNANYQGPKPELRWQRAAASDAARVVLCADRGCSRIIGSWAGVDSVTVDSELSPGAYFWYAVGRRKLDDGTWFEGTERSPTWEFVVDHSGISKKVGFGYLPDHDGDGRADVVVTNSNDTGSSVFITSSATAYRIPANATSLSQKQKIYCDYASGSYEEPWRFAYYWRNVGDVNGDGFADAVTVTDANLVVPKIRLYRGGASLISGGDLTIGTAMAERISAVETVGDVNGDGYADVALQFITTVNGTTDYQIILVRGSSSGLSVPDAPISLGNLQYALIHSVGDINGDGYTDVTVDNQDYLDPKVMLYLGSTDGLPKTPSKTFAGVWRSWPVGDVNRDGYPDLIVSPPVVYSVQVISGPGFLLRGGVNPEFDTQFPIPFPSIQCTDCTKTFKYYPAGDVNGDGYADVILTGTVKQAPLSRVYVFYGSANGLGPERMRQMYNPDDVTRIYNSYYGWTVAALGDINGDAIDDLAIAAADKGAPGVTGRIQPKIRIYKGTSIGAAIDETWLLQSYQSTVYNDSFGAVISAIGGW